MVAHRGALRHGPRLHNLLGFLEAAAGELGDCESLEAGLELLLDGIDAFLAVASAVLVLLALLALRAVGVAVPRLAAGPALAIGLGDRRARALEIRMLFAAIGTFPMPRLSPLGRCGAS